MNIKKKLESIEDDGFAYICAVCQDFGELICCELCGQAFHLHCLRLDSLPEEDPWICNNCKEDKIQCFECKEVGNASDGSISKCVHRSCKKFYHQKCVQSWQRQIYTKEGLVCPQHACDACGSGMNSGQWKLFRCFECPRAYHEKCFPEDSLLLEDIPGYMICWKHAASSKFQYQRGEKLESITSIFRSLPVPDQVCEFEVPDVYQNFVKDLKTTPQPFVHIKRNIYLVKRPKRRLEDEYMQCACASGGSSRAACEKDCICSMLQYSCSASCGCGAACANLPFQKRLGKKLELTKTERCGWGLQAAEPIKAGDFLIEYVGEVIDDETCEERFWEMKQRCESNFYMCEINREMVVDATFKGNISRFINHSCHPNTELQKWQIDEELRIGVFAISDIQEGDCISYDYQFIPFGQEQDCFCGASGCRGKLGRRLSKNKILAITALKVVQRELLMIRRTKRSKFCAAGVESGYRSIEHFFPMKKLKFPSISISEAKIGGAPVDNTISTYPCIGRKVQIWWPLDQKFYNGTITLFDNLNNTHKIEYDDGHVEVLHMDEEIWELQRSTPSMDQRAHDDGMNACASEESFTAK